EGAEERRDEAQPGRAPDVLGRRSAQQERDIDLVALKRGGLRSLVGQAAEDQSLDRGSLAAVALEGFEHQLDARIEAHELVGAGPDGRLAKGLLAYALDVLPGHHPAGAGHEGA